MWVLGASASGSGVAEFEGFGAEVAWDDGPVFGEEIGVGTVGEFLGSGEASVALVELAGAFYVVVVFAEGAVVVAAGVVAVAGALAVFELPAAA